MGGPFNGKRACRLFKHASQRGFLEFSEAMPMSTLLTSYRTNGIEILMRHTLLKDQFQFIRSEKAVIERLSNDPKTAFIDEEILMA
jgi:hypothetical protein